MNAIAVINNIKQLWHLNLFKDYNINTF